MNDSFKAVDFEGFSPIAKAIGDLPSNFCDHTPYVILTWQKYHETAFAEIDGYPILRNTVEDEYCYSPLTGDITGAVKALLSRYDSITLSPITEESATALSEAFDVYYTECNDGWSDYIYDHSKLASLSGKAYSGQRNHINKFTAAYPDWHYEEITADNLHEVLDFYVKLTSDTTGFDNTALYERQWLLEYLGGYFYRLTLSGGLIRANGEILSFAFGEVIRDMLYVHVEKARRDVQGAYPMIVREFARHNTAKLINREEDMGIEGLRTSKMSYHPLKLEKKYKLRIRK